jgi:hypothetical protein
MGRPPVSSTRPATQAGSPEGRSAMLAPSARSGLPGT